MSDLATPDDVARRMRRPLTPAEEDLASVLISDASTLLRAEYPGIDAQIGASLPAATVVQVIAGIVKRAMLSGDAEGVKSDSETVGPYSVSRTYENAFAALYLTAADRLLVAGRQPKARSVRYG